MVGNRYMPQRFHMEPLERSVRFFMGSRDLTGDPAEERMLKMSDEAC